MKNILMWTFMLTFTVFVAVNFDTANQYPIWVRFPICFLLGLLISRGVLSYCEDER